jgi:hypothetical protein
MEADFQLQEFPLNCEKCERQGFIFVEDLDKSHFVVCQECGGETSNVWCHTCQMGGSFVRNIKRRPKSWSCPSCHKSYALPPSFYTMQVPLFGIEELPITIQERIRHSLAAARPRITLGGLVLLALFMILLIALFLWPAGLGFWLTARTQNPLWAFLGFPALFAWIHFGRPIIQIVLDWGSKTIKKFNAIHERPNTA